MNSPNDLIISKQGEIYFTDPPYGLEKNMKDTLKELPFQGVYKITPGGKLVLLVDSITRPNGIAFLEGERSLVIANSDSAKAVWYKYDITNDSLINGRIFYDATPFTSKDKGLPDGLKVDRKGNIFATGPGGVWVFNSEGKLLGKIRVNGVTSNCALADDDKTLYITADMYLLRVLLRK